MFNKVSCSQCGKEFGPALHGYSHCKDHKEIELTQAEQNKVNRLATHVLARVELAKRLVGESPHNDTSTWDGRAIQGLEVFRDCIRETLNSMDCGRMSVESAVHLIDICKGGIDAFIQLDTMD